MEEQLLHTPEGVRDIYDAECARKQKVEEKISHVFSLYGYRDIETPTFEFFDVFSKERGSVSSTDMYKFFDRDNNTLVLKPDMTPAIARCAAKYYNDETMPIRLCYRERTYVNGSSYKGSLKEVTQTGAELIGDDTPQADAEMIVMLVSALKETGLSDFQVELGDVEFFRGLVEEAGMDPETQETLRELIDQKNYFGVEELIDSQTMPDDLGAVLLKMPDLYGSLEEILKVRSLISNSRARQAIERLEEVYSIIEDYGLAEYVSFDLGMLSKYQYYTGIIFKAYTYGTGQYIVTGGRYDKLLTQFGKDSPAVGFAIVIDQLMLALNRQGIDIPLDMPYTILLYCKEQTKTAIMMAEHLRNNDIKTAMICKKDRDDLSEYLSYAERSGFPCLICISDDGQKITVKDLTNNDSHEMGISEFMENGEDK